MEQSSLRCNSPSRIALLCDISFSVLHQVSFKGVDAARDGQGYPVAPGERPGVIRPLRQ